MCVGISSIIYCLFTCVYNVLILHECAQHTEETRKMLLSRDIIQKKICSEFCGPGGNRKGYVGFEERRSSRPLPPRAAQI